ncbi:YraN family protein [Salana multivorans]
MNGAKLDIVALDGECVVVLEVKTRSSTSLGGPIAAVTRQKVQRLRQLTGEWLVRGRVEWAAGSPDGACGAAAVVLSGTADIRIDVLGILWPPDATPRFEHVRGIG